MAGETTINSIVEAIFDPGHVNAQFEYEKALFGIASHKPAATLTLGVAELSRHGYRQDINPLSEQKSTWARARHLLRASACFDAWEELWQDKVEHFTDEAKIANLLSKFQNMVDGKILLGEKANPDDVVAPHIENQSLGLERAFVETVKADLLDFVSQLMPEDNAQIPQSKPIGISLSRDQKIELANRILSDMEVDFDRLEICNNVQHPMCLGNEKMTYLGLNPDKGDSISYFILEVVHEAFHVYLRQNTPIMTHAAIDEVFAMLGDHIIARSSGFSQYITGVLHDMGFSDLKADVVYNRLNEVKYNKARIALDPLQYPRGIALLYELEVAMLEGKITSDTLASFFKAGHRLYHGREPESEVEGPYQDMQPFTGEAYLRSASYLVAQPAAFQVFRTLENQISTWEMELATGNWSPIKAFVIEAAKKTRCYDLQQFVMDVTGQPYNLGAYKSHMISKYVRLKPCYRLGSTTRRAETLGVS